MQIKEKIEIKNGEASTFTNPYYVDAQMQTNVNPTLNSILGTTPNERFFRGLIIGAAATYLLTNESAQKAIIKTGMKLYETVVGGVEEMKEKIMDAQAEYEAQKSEG